MTEPIETKPVAEDESKELDLASDAPLAPVCDLSGDKTCESCQ